MVESEQSVSLRNISCSDFSEIKSKTGTGMYNQESTGSSILWIKYTFRDIRPKNDKKCTCKFPKACFHNVQLSRKHAT